jgi:hypothetical protein
MVLVYFHKAYIILLMIVAMCIDVMPENMYALVKAVI